MKLSKLRITTIATLILISVPALTQGGPVFSHDGERTLTRESFAGASSFKPEEAFKYSQASVGRNLGAYVLRDTLGRSVSLSDFQGKPLILSFVYSSCHHTCPLT
ncbi:MAG: SCO family protein, partial [Rhodospirillales bacterium]|nr:SCO family protein [Rhodospirillales bacterium]